MLLNILSSLNSFKIIPYVFIIHYKHFHINKLKIIALVQILTQKHGKINTNFMSSGSCWCECTHVVCDLKKCDLKKSEESGEALGFMFPLLPNEILLQHT